MRINKMYKKTKYIIIGIVIFLLFEGCSKKYTKNKDDNAIAINSTSHSISELHENIILNGDIEAYDHLEIAYMNNENYDFLIWAYFMANEYHYAQAYYDVYSYLGDLCNDDYSRLNEKTFIMAINHLKKAAELKHHQALEVLGGYYIEGKYVEKDPGRGNELIKESEKQGVLSME